ncbi:MAG: TIGR04283 family arsenosugar biosynthesis glycosyltransferase [Pusillimonas sp.]|nr:TIGR04283 family arsenosugar biosynthesis glycosyltransferase [Pusillimonas sp.]
MVPTLNEASDIVGTLWALEPLRKRGVEIIVVDGNSKDATAKLAASHADLVVNSCPGRASQMNAGAMHASAQTLLFLHADTVLPDNADTVVLNALNDAPGWGRFDVKITGTHPMLKVIALLINIRSRLTGIATGDQAIFISRSLYLQIGGFPNQPLMEDIEICKQLRRLQRPECVAAKVQTSGRRWETRGVWRTIMLMWRLRWLYWRGVPATQLVKEYR